MSQYTSFDHFARDLFLCRSNSEVKISDKRFNPIPLMRHAEGALDLFQDGHGTFFQEIFKPYEYREFRSDEQFFRFAIPRCLKLIDSERYFYSMMLVASFLLEFLVFMKDTRYCYRFCYTAYKCFLAVFKRVLEDGFEAHGGLEGLAKFSKEAFESVDTSEKYKYLPIVFNNDDPSLTEKVIELIEKCDCISDESFQLNDYELSLLKDDEIDEVLRSLENATVAKDPLDLHWPPGQEEIKEKLRSATQTSPIKVPPIYSFVSESEGFVVEESEDKSVVEESEDKFVVEEIEDKCVAEESEDKSVVEENEDKMVVEESEDKIVVEESEDKIVVEESEDKSVVEESEDKFVVEEIEDKCVAEKSEDKIVAEESEDEFVVEESEDEFVVEEIIVYRKPDLFSYIITLESEAKQRLGCQLFKEKLELRKCPCCGIKCFQFSHKLYIKQLDSALVDDSKTEENFGIIYLEDDEIVFI